MRLVRSFEERGGRKGSANLDEMRNALIIKELKEEIVIFETDRFVKNREVINENFILKIGDDDDFKIEYFTKMIKLGRHHDTR